MASSTEELQKEEAENVSWKNGEYIHKDYEVVHQHLMHDYFDEYEFFKGIVFLQQFRLHKRMF